MQSLVNDASVYSIRVDTTMPTSTNTDMIHNEACYSLFGVSTPEEFATAYRDMNTLPVDWNDPVDMANAALFFASDDALHVTGLNLYVDAGFFTKVP